MFLLLFGKIFFNFFFFFFFFFFGVGLVFSHHLCDESWAEMISFFFFLVVYFYTDVPVCMVLVGPFSHVAI